ncbi:MAG: glutaminyl-peptide cyclotransferase [Bacteroidales bacterium]|nr:glutaminyl-peptide cyclotransferase [Bacteroidales bacterium]
MMRIPGLLLLSLFFFTARSCSSGNGSTERIPVSPANPDKITRLLEPSAPLSIPVGEEIRVVLVIPDTVRVDSVNVYLGGKLKRSIHASAEEPVRGSFEFLLPGEGENTGKSGLRLRLFFADGRSENHSSQLTFLSNVKPREYTYQVVSAYPHDVSAYTQGLEYVDGVLYEGTGNYGTSSLRRVSLETGEVTRIRNLDQSLFGEGISVLGDRIYQLTYKSQVGFIYDRATFEEIQKVYYQNREGWGLTNNGQELIMSDGTNVIYFLDPEMFTIKRQIEVYHDQGPASSLNELEYIDGKIWANRYFTDEIVIIDPQTGRVEGRINLKGILKATDRKPDTDVLNGIAWDREGDRIFVTGKRWPLLFEIRIIESGT